MTALKDIVFETDRYWVKQVPKGYEVYKTGLTHSTRVGIIGYTGDKGLQRAKQEIARREGADAASTASPARHHSTLKKAQSSARATKTPPAQLQREINEALTPKSARGAHALLTPAEARRLAKLPDEALCKATQGNNGLWYAVVALDRNWPSDPDFSTARKDKREALRDCATKVRADLRGKGAYAPHWSPYDVTYRLLPYWEQRAAQR